MHHHHQPITHRALADYIGDPTLADAILDRLVHSAHKIHLEADKSMRDRAARRRRKRMRSGAYP